MIIQVDDELLSILVSPNITVLSKFIEEIPTSPVPAQGTAFDEHDPVIPSFENEIGLVNVAEAPCDKDTD